MTRFQLMIAGAVLAACQSGGALPAPHSGADIALTKLPDGQSPHSAAGICWASATTPAVIETVTEQVMVRSERRDANGQIIRTAQFETKTAQRLVQDRETVWFRAPCAPDITVSLIASLQRALKARGRFYAEITGVYDAATGAAVRKLQAERGLDSPVLAQETIRELGLAASGAR